jgi:aminoglycoside phosphotransferase (APT) family kinase protein
VAWAVASWLAVRFGQPVVLTETPRRVGEGSDNEIHCARFGGQALPPDWTSPLVLRVSPSADRLGQVNREAAIQTFCVALGYPAPRVLEVLGPGQVLDVPVLVMERAPGDTMLAAMLRHPRQIRAQLTRLATLQAQLHTLPTGAWPHRSDRGRRPPLLAERRLGLVHAALEDGVEDRALGEALARTEELLPFLAGSDEVVCHGDLHPLNVLVAAQEVHVVDWTDACLCDPHGDVARTVVAFDLAPLAIHSAAARSVVRINSSWMRRRYLAAYVQSGPGRAIDARRLHLWERVHLLHDWAKAAVADTPVTPQIIRSIRRRLARSLPADGSPR